MPIALIMLALVLLAIVLLGAKLAMVFGFVVACATFSFPLGLIGMVAIGVSLLFLLSPRQGTD